MWPRRRFRVKFRVGEGNQNPTSVLTPDGCAGPPPQIQPGPDLGYNRGGGCRTNSPPLPLLRAPPILTSSPFSVSGRLRSPYPSRPQTPLQAPEHRTRLEHGRGASRPARSALSAARGKMAVFAQFAGWLVGAQISRPTPPTAPGVRGSNLQPLDTPVDPVSSRIPGGL